MLLLQQQFIIIITIIVVVVVKKYKNCIFVLCNFRHVLMQYVTMDHKTSRK